MIVSLADLRDQLGLDPNKTDEDATLTRILASQQAWIESLLGGRSLEARSLALFLSGDGTDTLRIGQGPLQTIAAVSSVTYAEAPPPQAPGDPTGAVPVLEAISPLDYRVLGDASSEGKLPARLVMENGVWLSGVSNYKVECSAGWPLTPPTVEGEAPGPWTGPAEIAQLVIDLAVWRRNRRRDVGLKARDIGVPGAMTFESDAEMLRYVYQIIGPYCDPMTVPVSL